MVPFLLSGSLKGLNDTPKFVERYFYSTPLSFSHLVTVQGEVVREHIFVKIIRWGIVLCLLHLLVISVVLLEKF